jgi:uncharacterized protein YdiU (UPF0061 family)
LQALVDYALARHPPSAPQTDNPALNLFDSVMTASDRRSSTDWMRVGFIHGVMNTDNMSISGETIDYGPCAFMDDYHPATVYSSIDRQGRYAFFNQPRIAAWNLARLGGVPAASVRCGADGRPSRSRRRASTRSKRASAPHGSR